MTVLELVPNLQKSHLHRDRDRRHLIKEIITEIIDQDRSHHIRDPDPHHHGQEGEVSSTDNRDSILSEDDITTEASSTHLEGVDLNSTVDLEISCNLSLGRIPHLTQTQTLFNQDKDKVGNLLFVINVVYLLIILDCNVLLIMSLAISVIHLVITLEYVEEPQTLTLTLTLQPND